MVALSLETAGSFDTLTGNFKGQNKIILNCPKV